MKNLRVLLVLAAIILIPELGKANSVVFKLVKPMKLVGSEKLDFTVTFQGGRRIRTVVDESKPFCQIFFNSDTVQSHNGHMRPMSMVSATSSEERRVASANNTRGLISVQFSSSKAEAFPRKDSFSVSCSLLSSDDNKISFTFDQISKVLGPSFSVTPFSGPKRGIASTRRHKKSPKA